jgi:outer membrane lipoprotein
MKIAFTVALALLFLVGCGVRVLPEEAMRQVDPSVDFSQVRADPQRYVGTTLLVGGRIIANRSTQEGSVLEILPYRLDRSGMPLEIDGEGGRFLARSERFLDPEVYERGSLITMTGTVLGTSTSTVNEMTYTWPLFRVGAIHLWRAERFEPYRYTYPYPYYSPRYYHRFHRPFDPFWHDPFWGPRWHDPFWYR